MPGSLEEIRRERLDTPRVAPLIQEEEVQRSSPLALAIPRLETEAAQTGRPALLSPGATSPIRRSIDRSMPHARTARNQLAALAATLHNRQDQVGTGDDAVAGIKR